MAGGQVCNFARVAGGFSIPAWCLVLIGRDTTHVRGEHPNFQERALEEATPEGVAGIVTLGSRVQSVDFTMEEIPADRFRPEFLKRARATWKRDCAASGGKREWVEPDRWPVVVDGRHRTVSGRAAEEKVNETFYLVSNHKKLDDAERVGVQAAANAYVTAYTPMQKALDLVEFSKRNASEEAQCAYLNCTRQTLANLRKVEDLCPEVRAAVMADTVAFTQAIKWAAMSATKQREALAAYLAPKPTGNDADARKAPSRKDAARVGAEVVAGKHPKIPREVGWALQILAGKMDATDYPELAALLAGKVT